VCVMGGLVLLETVSETVDAEADPAMWRGRLSHYEPMSRHVSWRAGGAAERFYVPADLQDLAAFLAGLPDDEPVHLLGLGSNTLVRDGGIRGTVILLHGVLRQIHLEQRVQGMAWQGEGINDHVMVYAEAGVAAPKLARFAANHDLTGAEFLAGIPGTVGGALAMNAGCYGGETWNHVKQVLTLDREGHFNERLPREYEVGYRHVARKGVRCEVSVNFHDAPDPEEFFIAAWFCFERGDGAASREKIKELLRLRVASQPLNLPNAGSVFRNPPEDHAARLIESCGLKGVREGNAQVSEKHANFIVNLGGARAGDIERLILRVEREVLAKTGVRLVREVRIVGDD
jgi:UDP-N-acetylmuramate dehydrogenase